MDNAERVRARFFSDFSYSCGLVLLTLAVGAAPALAQDKPAASPAPNLSTTAKSPDVSKEALVFDQLHTRLREEVDGSGTRETTAKIRVLADAGVKEKKPADDIDIGSPGELDYSTSIQLPSGWSVFPMPGTSVQEDWAEYRSSYTFSDGTWSVERHLTVKKDKIPLDQWEKYLAFRRAIFNDEVRMTPLQNPAEPDRWQAAIGAAFAPQIFGPGGQAQLADEAKRRVVTDLENLRNAAQLLETTTPVSAENARKASAGARKAVDDLEAATRDLPSTDVHSLYWAQLLGYGWSTLGWAALDGGDLPTAETYLRPAWRLCHDRLAGYQYARLLAAKGNKTEAAHQFELAHITTVNNPLGGFLASEYKVDDLIDAGYKGVAGKGLTATALSGGRYDGSLAAELDNGLQMRSFIHSTKLTGSGLFALVFEAGKPMKASFLGGDKGFAALTMALEAHNFPAQLPVGSKARLMREVRMICSPWGGCDAYLLLPGAIEMPSISAPMRVMNVGKETKPVQIKLHP